MLYCNLVLRIFLMSLFLPSFRLYVTTTGQSNFLDIEKQKGRSIGPNFSGVEK